MGTIGAKVEKAFAQLIANLNIAGLSAYTGIGELEVDTPAAIASALTASEEFPGGGIYHVLTRITVKHMAADSDRDTADGITGQVFKACIEADTGALGALGDGINIFGLFVQPMEQSETGDAWRQELTLDVVATLGNA